VAAHVIQEARADGSVRHQREPEHARVVLRDLVGPGDLLGAGLDLDAGGERLAQRPHASAGPHLRFEHRDRMSERLQFVRAVQSPASPPPITMTR
jgi:hypothetical protein